MSHGGAGPAALDHTALLHRGADELATAMAGPLTEAVDRGEAVLVSLTPEAWDPLRRALGPAAGAVRWLHADDRYATPAGAMLALHRFVTDAVDAGAPAAWSLGALAFDGTVADDAWFRYEHAVNDVLAALPLHAVCAYDIDATPAAALAHAHAAHGGGSGTAVPEPPAVTPTGAPVVDAVVADGAEARRLVDAHAGPLPPAVREDVRLVVSELVANGVRHGLPPVRLVVWSDADDADGGDGVAEVVVRVHDAGPGIADPYVDLRPPHADGRGGRGLNIVAQLAHLHVARDGRGTTVTAVVRP